MHSITPGILEKTAKDIDYKLQIIKPFSRYVHIDILDGKFCEETSFLDVDFFKKYKDDFFMEAHLMVDDPIQYIEDYANAGFKKFLGHVEKMTSLDEFIALSQVFGEVGVAIDCQTKIDDFKLPFDSLDEILLMSVKAGKSGQEFMNETLDKIKIIKNQSDIKIAVDGGINDKTILDAKKAGAKRFITTSYIFNADDPMQAYERLSSLT